MLSQRFPSGYLSSRKRESVIFNFDVGEKSQLEKWNVLNFRLPSSFSCFLLLFLFFSFSIKNNNRCWAGWWKHPHKIYFNIKLASFRFPLFLVSFFFISLYDFIRLPIPDEAFKNKSNVDWIVLRVFGQPKSKS